MSFFYNCAMFWTLIWVQEARALLRTVWTDNPLDCKSSQEQTGIEKYPWTFNFLFVCWDWGVRIYTQSRLTMHLYLTLVLV